MKIFNWVHRRFNPAILRDELGGKSPECMARNPREGVDLSDVLDGWKDFGILTIGTFGYDPLKRPDQGKEGVGKEEEEFPAEAETDEEEEEEEGGAEEDEADLELDPLIPTAVMLKSQEFGTCAVATWDQAGTDAEMELTSVVEIKKRVTLADLFSADSDNAEDVKGKQRDGRPCKEVVFLESGEKLEARKDPKGRRSLAKKILHHIGTEDLRPMKKISRLMRKMMGRKIHPDVGFGKVNDKENQLRKIINAAKVQGDEVGESRSLLQSNPQGIITL